MRDDVGTQHRLFAIVLAAGESKRFGSVKQLATLGSETLVCRAARVARACCHRNTAIVVGHRAWDVLSAAGGQCQFALVNDRHAQGIGTSIALAATAFANLADALVLLLADQPLVRVQHLERLIAAWSGDDTHIVTSRYRHTTGPPVLLPRGSFASLRELKGDSGAKALLGDDRFSVTELPLEEAALDIDTPADLERLYQAAE